MNGVLGAGGEIGIGGGEAAEVVFAKEGCRSSVETGEIYGPRVGVDVAREERRADLRHGGLDGENAVFVGFGDGGVAGVESVGDDLCGEDADRSGQGAVERANKVGGRDARLKGKTGDLGESVHAGVGAAGTLGQRGFADDAAEGGLQFALDSVLARAGFASRGSRCRRRRG